MKNYTATLLNRLVSKVLNCYTLKVKNLVPLVLVSILLVSCNPTPSENTSPPVVDRWDVFEDSLTNQNGYDNPFEDVSLQVTYTSPDGESVDFWGFYSHDQTWKFRFMPHQAGTWQYEARFSDGAPGKAGTFEVVASDIPGLIHQDETNPLWFGYRGSGHELIRSFHVGDRLFANTPNTVTGADWSPARRQEFLDWVQEHDYNTLSVASFYLNRNVENRGLGWQTPNLWDSTRQVPNSAAYDTLEVILDDLKARQLIIYPFAGFFGKEADFPRDPAKQELYVKYTLARFAPYWNHLFLVGGPEPLYKKNPHLSKEEVIRLGHLIDSLDVFNHLLSVHSPTGDDPFKDEPWLNYSIMQGPKTLDRDELSEGLLRNHHPSKPLYAQETLWPGNTYGHPDFGVEGIRKNAYVITMSAAAINFADMDGNSSSGFSGTLDFELLHPEYHEAIRRVWDFFEQIPFYNMSPRPDLTDNGYLLAQEGEQYLLYLEQPGTANLNTSEGTYYGVWINAQNPSDTRKIGAIQNAKNLSSPSEGDDWLLYLMTDEEKLNKIVSELATLTYEPLRLSSLDAIHDFNYPTEGFAAFYPDKGDRKEYLAIDPMKYQDQWAAARTTYQGAPSTYDLSLITYKEYDGESNYRFRLNDRVVATFQNPAIQDKSEEGEYTFTLEDIELKPDDVLVVEAQAQSNKKLPEEGAPGGYGWSRGRWKQLVVR